jgi:hypothetical protein
MTSTSHIQALPLRGALRPRLSCILLATSLALCASPSLAAAAQRFAAPNSQGTGKCTSEANACKLQSALGGAASGDEVILAGNLGSYGTAAVPITSTLRVPGGVYGVDVHGAAGQPRPVIYAAAAEGMRLVGAHEGRGFSVSDIDIEHLTGGAGLQITGTADHVLVHSTASSDYVCEISGSAEVASSITDSACIGDGDSDYGLFDQNEESAGTATVALRNDTFEAPATDSYGIAVNAEEMGANVSVSNAIAHGGFRDIDAYQVKSSSLTVTLDHSNYATLAAESGTSVTAPGTATNQTAPPLFVNAPGDDFREAPGSPTIDAGAIDPVASDTDLNGNPRTIGASTDIGAFEASEAPGLTVGALTALGTSTATVNASVNPNYSAGSYHLEYGPSTSYGSSTAILAYPGAGLTALPVSFALSNLTSGTTYHYRLVASNAIGTSFSPDQTFKTAGIAPGSPGYGGVISLGGHTTTVLAGSASVKVTCSAHSGGCNGTLQLTEQTQVLTKVDVHSHGKTISRPHKRTIVHIIGSVPLHLTAGQTTTLKISLSGPARAQLAHAKNHRLTVDVTTKRSDGGTPQSEKLTLVLGATKAKHSHRKS